MEKTTSGEVVREGFPADVDEFDADDRVSFSKTDGKWILETDEGTEYEWDNALKRWIQALDQSLIDQQNEAYKMAGVDEEVVKPQKKRKEYTNGGEDKPEPKQKKARINTAVYVTSIPLDADLEEINHVFKTCGVIAEEIDSGQPRIKMYEDDNGAFKGDALVVYFRPESVQLAIQMLDDTSFRLGFEGPMGRMRVSVADYSYKKQTEAPTGKPNKKDQKRIIKKTEKLNSRLADWSDDEPSALTDTSSKWDKVVILKHMFTLEELAEDPGAVLDIKDDIREECAKLGEVTNVQLFDKEADGIVSVRFTNVQAAQACIRLMNGRWFEARQVEAYTADGSEKFKKTNEKKVTYEKDDEDGEDDRLDKFGNWLEEGTTKESES